MAISGQGHGEIGAADPLLAAVLARAVPVEMLRMAPWDSAKRLDVARERWAGFQPAEPVNATAAVCPKCETPVGEDCAKPHKQRRALALSQTSGAGHMSGGVHLRYGGIHAAGEFAALATVIAALAFSPGGVTVFGRHWCADHAACEAAAAEAARRLAA